MGSINKLGNYKVAISLDGYWVLSKSKETLVVQDVITGEIQRTLTKQQVHKKSMLKGVNLSAKSIDGFWAILGFVDNTFDEWYLPQKLNPYKQSANPPFVLRAISFDSRLALRETKRGSLQIQDLSTGEIVYSFDNKYGGFKKDNPSDGIIFSFDGDFVLLPIANYPNSKFEEEIGYRIWNFSTGRITPILISYLWTTEICSVSVSTDGKIGIFGLLSGEIKVCDLKVGRERFTLKNHPSQITCLSVSSDDRLLTSISIDGTLNVWELKNGEEVCSFKLDTEIYSCVLHRNNEVIIVGDKVENINLFELILPLKEVQALINEPQEPIEQIQSSIIKLKNSCLIANLSDELRDLPHPIKSLSFKGIPDIGHLTIALRFEGIGILNFMLFHSEYGMIYEYERIAEEYEGFYQPSIMATPLPRSPWEQDLFGILSVSTLSGELISRIRMTVSCALSIDEFSTLEALKQLYISRNYESELKFLNKQIDLLGENHEDVRLTLFRLIEICENGNLASDAEIFRIRMNKIYQDRVEILMCDMPRVIVYANANEGSSPVLESNQSNLIENYGEDEKQTKIEDDLEDFFFYLQIMSDPDTNYKKNLIVLWSKFKIILQKVVLHFKSKFPLDSNLQILSVRSKTFLANVLKFIVIISVFTISFAWIGLTWASWITAILAYILVGIPSNSKQNQTNETELILIGFTLTLLFLVPFVLSGISSGATFGSSQGITLGNNLGLWLKSGNYWSVIVLIISTTTLGQYIGEIITKNAFALPMGNIIFSILVTLFGAKNIWGTILWILAGIGLVSVFKLKLNPALQFLRIFSGFFLGYCLSNIISEYFADDIPQGGVVFRCAMGLALGTILTDKPEISISGQIGALIGVCLGFFLVSNSSQAIVSSVFLVLSIILGSLLGGLLGALLGVISYLLFAIPASVILACLGKAGYEVAVDIKNWR